MLHNTFKRLTAFLLCLALALSYVPFSAMDSAAATYDTGSKIADESTMDSWLHYFGRNDTAYAGAVWTDKSVFTDASAFSDVTQLADGSGHTVTADPDNFIVALSAIASTSQITGYSTTPTDTMLVLDVSGSMASTYTAGYSRSRVGNRYQYSAVSACDPEIVNAMVDAANDAIHKLLTLNEHNRVGVVLYSGNTATGSSSTGTGTLLLPLGRYTGVADGASVAYLSADLTHSSGTLYEEIGRNNYQSMGTVTYCTRIDVSLTNGLKTDTGTPVSDVSKQVVGGTYIQNGLAIAWQQFEGRIQAGDTVIPEGKVQAGTARMPIMVLMSDGSPTTATTSYNDIGTSLYGNGSSNHATSSIGFLTQLTASWVRDKMATGYATAPRFYTLGLADAGTQATAVGVLNPSSASNNASGYWNELLNPNDGRVSLTLPKTSSQNDTTTATVSKLDNATLMKNYVDQYWYASDADDMVNAFTQIVNEIILQSKYYATLVESDQHHVDGYITVTDELGAFMEVKEMTGIVLGSTLYSGYEMAHAMTSGVLGTPGNPSSLGNEFIWTVMERMGIEDASEAQNLVDNAYNTYQLYPGDDTHAASNYIGWYADENGNYLSHWSDTHTDEDRPANAVYTNKSYGYLGKHASNLHSDMMHIVVKVSTNIATGHQTVSFQIPASLIPMITYSISIDSDSLATAQEITLSSDLSQKSPMRLLFEVGLRDDINPVTVDEIVGTSDHYHKNADGSYSFYTNMWGITDMQDPHNPTSHLVTTAFFDPSFENEYYRFKEPERVLDAGGNPVSSLDTSGSTQYYYQRQVISGSGSATVSNVLMPLSAKDLAYAEYEDGSYVIPAGSVNMPSNDVRMHKTDLDPSTSVIEHPTNTLDYYTYPYGVYYENANDFVMYAYLGNNGTFTMTPATGLKLTKTVTEVIPGADDSFTFTVTLSQDAPNASVTDEHGNVKASGWSVSGNVVTVTVSDKETVCIIGLPAGATYTVEEADTQYKSTVTPATGTLEDQTLIEVNAVNRPAQHGDLIISKEVVHPFEVDPTVLSTKDFTFTVQLSGAGITKDQTYESTMGTVVILDDGMVGLADGSALILNNDESVTIYGLPEDTVFTVTETAIPDGFALESINGSTQLTAATGSITANETAAAAFVNRYPANDFEEIHLPAQLTVEKILSDPGSNYTDDEDFRFVLESLIPGTDGYVPVGQVLTAKAGNTATGNPSLSFTTPGVYHFRIVELSGTTPGMTYSTTKALFRVTVADTDMNGKLEVTDVTAEANLTVDRQYDAQQNLTGITVLASFTNVYSLEATSTTLDVHKTLVNNTGVEKSATEFQFRLYAADADGVTSGSSLQTVTTGALGSATFTIPVETRGSHYYVVEEVIPEGAVTVNGLPVLNGMTYDPAQYLLQIVAEPDKNGALVITERSLTLIGDESYTEHIVASFTNTYALESAEWGLSFIKHMIGRNLLTTDRLVFYAERTDATFTQAHSDTSMNREMVISPDSDEGASIHSVQYNFRFAQAGTYYFRLYEANSGQTVAGITYDSTEYHITVTVTDNGDGTLKAAGQIHKLGSPDAITGYPEFTNVYTVTGTAELPIGGTKLLTGRKLNAGEFTFRLSDSEGNVLQTANNHANGHYAFQNLVFTADQIGSTFTYTVTEEAGTLGGITYSEQVYHITVTVVDNGAGGVALDVTSDSGSGGTEDLTFRNSYTCQPVSVTLSGFKTLTGRDLKDGEFTFELVDSYGNVVQSVTNENGRFTFSPLYYSYTDENRNDLGVYHYIIREHVPELGASDRLGGVWYDASTFEVTVSVTQFSGKMSANVTVTKPGVGEVARDSIGFGNTYAVEDEKELVLSGTKTLVGRALAEKEFYFQLKDENGNVVQSVPNDASGNFSFDALVYDETDLGNTYRYTVSEWLPAQEDERLPGVIYSNKVYAIAVTLSDNGDGTMQLSYTVDNVAQDVAHTSLDFVNTYGSEAVYVTLGGTKVMTGDRTELLSTDVYTFELVDPATGNVIDTAVNGADGSFTFDRLTFSYTNENVNDLGDHYYIIREKAGTLDGITYSQSHYDVKIVISDGGGQLTALVVVRKDDSQMVTPDQIVFENIYTNNDEQELVLSGTKELTGREMIGSDFTFQLLDEDGHVLQEVTNNFDGAIVFEPLVYNISHAGNTYTYTVRELIPAEKEPGITYDTTEYTVTVTVTDNGDGTLKLDYTGQTNALNFTNRYSVTPTSVTISGEKKMDGDRTELIETDIYTFELVDAKTGAVIDTKQNGADGIFTFAPLTYLYTDENTNDLGEHRYIIREVEGSNGGVTFDTTQYEILVTVTDEGGKLSAAVEISNGVEAVTDVVYTNLYAVVSTSVTLSGTKELTGRQLQDGEFTFAVLENGDEVATGTNDSTGNILFQELIFEHAGTYHYTVVEKVPDNASSNIAYDDAQFQVTVDVTDNGDGTLSASVTYSEAIVFENVFTPDEIMVEFPIFKTTETDSNEVLSPEGFRFALSYDGSVVSTESADANGHAFFYLWFDDSSVGSHSFTVYEIDDGQTGVIYDSKVYEITVNISQDPVSGQLSADYIINGEPAEYVALTFHNIYEEPQIPETGDSFSFFLPVALMLVSALAIFVLIPKKKEN